VTFAGGCGPGRAAQLTYEDARMKLKRGQLESAGEVTDRAYGRYPSEESEWHWRFKVLKAEILARQGLIKESLDLLRADPPATLAVADLAVRRKVVQGVASAWLRQGPSAEQYLTDAQTLARAHHPELLGEVALGRGAADFLASDLRGAAMAYQDALQTARKQKDLYVETLGLAGLGAVATKEERYDESIDWNQAALQLAQSLDAQNSLAQILGNMAWSYRKLGDFDSALAFYKQAEEVSAHAGLIELQIYWLTGTSNVYYQQHDYDAAKAVLTRGLNLAQSHGNKRTLIEYMNDLAEIELETGRIESAEKYYAEAIRLEQGSLDRSELLASQLVRGRIDVATHDYAQAEKSFREVIGDSKADTSQKWEAEARLARVYADVGRSADAEAEFRRSLAVVEAARSSVQAEDLRLSFLSSAITFYSDYIDFLIRRKRTADALRVAELSRARTLEEGLSASARNLSRPALDSSPERIARHFQATLLFYWIGQNQSHLWVINSAKTTHLELPKASEIESVVKSYRKALLGMRDAQDDGSAEGKKLYAMLVEPARKLIRHGSQVIVLPAESLYGLSFETLIVPDPQPHFWIEDVTLTTASSLTMLAASANRPTSHDKTLFLVGDTKPPDPPFAPLPQAAEEMKQVKKYFLETQTRVLEGGSATPTAFLRSHPEQFSYLHFVTHGTASHTRPLESAVILSKEANSYKLYARDIVQHRLNANLVTISACNGAGTRAYSGEGLVGLSWAFLRAGAHNVIGALWEVSDASTPQLMDAFYRELFEGRNPATALRNAKLTLLHSRDPDSVFRKPFYWAPFQLYAGS
jgi:CHAT domain-containing protein